MRRREGNEAVLYIPSAILVEKEGIQMLEGWIVPTGEKKRTR